MAVAENKYSLALVQTQTEKKIRPQPWYKERLHTKYVKALKPTDTTKHLEGKNWMFVKDGLDDFRDGLPPAVDGSDFIKTDKGPGPTITGSAGSPSSVKQPAQPRRFSKHQICFSRITPLQQQRREHIDEIEYGLLQHPLALYPHLEESVPPEMFEDIVDILDPEMNMVEEDDAIAEENEQDVTSDQHQQSSGAAAEDSQQHPLASARSAADSARSDKGEETNRVRNPYRWLPRKEEREKKDRRSLRDRANAGSPSQEEHIQKVTREFCQWVADLGGESNNIEESTITSLFASGYETKPALSVPIHVVELTNVPPELRMSASIPHQQQSAAEKAIPQAEQTKKEWKVTGEYEPSWVKFRYGAWYLPPKTWHKRGFDDPLADPKELKDQEMSDAKKKSHVLNQELSTMHASKAFMDFINKKTVRKPEFLQEVSEIQRKTAEEEQRRQEAELLAKQKKTATRKMSAK